MPDKIKITGDFHTTQDGFGYDKYANTILSMITSEDFPTPFTFGVFGEWGCGKTSLMRMIEKRLRDEYADVFIPVWFNPWRYEKEEHLIVPFLKTIQQAIESHIEENKSASKKLTDGAIFKLKKLGGRLSKIAFVVASSVAPEIEIEGAGQKLKLKADLSKGIDAAKDWEESAREQADAEKAATLSEYRSAYYDISRYLGEVSEQEPKGIRIAVFIDDLDRCLPEKSIEVLEGVKTFLDIPGYIFLIGVDRQVIEKGVRVKYRGYALGEDTSGAEVNASRLDIEIPITPSDYLEKIVQLPVTLPPIEKSRIQGYLKKLLDENKALGPYLDLIQLGLKQNPRTYKRFINTLAFHTKLAVEKGCLMIDGRRNSKKKLKENKPPKKLCMTLELLVKWTLINFAFQDLVKALHKRKLLLVEIQDWIERLSKEGAKTGMGGRSEEKDPILEAPPFITPWLQDDKLVAILSKDAGRGDKGFSKEDIDLYIQMGEFTSPDVVLKVTPGFMSLSGTAEVRVTGRMAKIPEGEFLYGEEKDKKNLKAYEIGIFPVTNREYKEFIDSKPDYDLPIHWDEENRRSPEGKEEHPVVNVSIKDAQAYCEWRSEKEGISYRLPTEEEWEKAARGTDGREYPWGDEFDKDKCNTSEAGIRDTTPVGKFKEGVSPYGCYDMSGNVWEWTSSEYESGGKVLRGGSWDTNHVNARCAYRFRYDPDFSYYFIGFRCARTSK